MQPYDPQTIITHYDALVQTYGDDVRSLDWGSRETQTRRFEVLASLIDLRGKSVLDVGCGLGDFYRYLRAQGIPTTYTGIDLTPSMIDHAQRLSPQADFRVGDALTIAGRYEVVVASGLFAFADAAFFRAGIRKLYEACTVACAFNALSTQTPIRDQREYYADPAETLRYAQTLSPWVTLRHDYMVHDFSVLVVRG